MIAESGSVRRVLVTGGASGIGAAITGWFLSEGHRVAVVDRDKAALREAFPAGRAPELLLPADVRDAEAVDCAFATIDAEWGGLDVLCNNAGISIRKPFLETTSAEWSQTLAVNLTGAFLVAQHAARRMVGSPNGGAVVNTASVSGLVGMPNYAAYNVSKAGLIELTRTMALELAPGVRVNAVCPGYVLTPMQRAEYTDRMLAECAAAVPAGRLGTPAEIAGLVGYLASDAAAFITGQSFVIDGGESAGGLASAPGSGPARSVAV